MFQAFSKIVYLPTNITQQVFITLENDQNGAENEGIFVPNPTSFALAKCPLPWRRHVPKIKVVSLRPGEPEALASFFALASYFALAKVFALARVAFALANSRPAISSVLALPR